MLETVEHTQKDVLGIAEDKTRTFTVLLEVKEVVTQRRSLPLLQQALDVTCRGGFSENRNYSIEEGLLRLLFLYGVMLGQIQNQPKGLQLHCSEEATTLCRSCSILMFSCVDRSMYKYGYCASIYGSQA